MHALLVRRHDVEEGRHHAGSFGRVAVAGGRVPRTLLSSVGVFCADTRDPVFAITYDDGPDPIWTPRVLDVLQRRGARATFFVLAAPARENPDVVRRIVEEGHEIALHGLDHRSLLTISTGAAVQSVRAARAEIEAIAGVPVRLYRPPYGEHSFRQAHAIRRLGLDFVIWSGDAHDWVHDAEESVAGRAIDSVFPGSILLLHDTRADPETIAPGEELPRFDRADVLDRVLRATQDDGYRTATVSDLLRSHISVRSVARERMVRP